MRERTLLAVGGLLALAGAASAQVTAIETSRTVTYNIVNDTSPGGGLNVTEGTQNGASQLFGDYYGYPSYDNYQTSTVINNTQGYVAFADNSTEASNSSGTMNATTVIQVTYKNPLSTSVNPQLNSTIIPGGFGVYMGNLTANPTYQGLAPPDNGFTFIPIVGDINQTPEVPLGSGGGFLELSNYGYTIAPAVDIADTSFSFKIYSGSALVVEYSATLSLYLDGATNTNGPTSVVPVLTTSFSGACAMGQTTGCLDNWGLIDSDSPDQAVGYSWDATDISVALGNMAAGASKTLTYVTSVTTDTSVGEEDEGDIVIAYSGFGDPIGKTAGGGGIPDPAFPLMDLGLPTFDPSTGTFTGESFIGYEPNQSPLTDINLVTGGTPTPEPQSWVMLLAGVGLAGWTLRAGRSRVK